MYLKNILGSAAIALLCLAVSSCQKNDAPELSGAGNVMLEFEHRVATQLLRFNTQNYTNANGDDFKVNVFKYYLSNVTFIKADGSQYKVPESYLLIDAADPNSLFQKLEQIPAGDYNAIELTLGVDEARNFSGAQTGALDPAKGMFWTWNSGYIFLKFEGSSSKSTQPSNNLFFHVGGAKAPANAVRRTRISLPVTLRVRPDAEPDVHFICDVSSLFKGKTTINFANISAFHGGANGLLVADNYADALLRVDHIHN